MSPKPDALTLAEALDIRLPPRHETIDLMLVDHNEVQNTLNSGFGGRGSGNWGFQMPATFTRSHRRLHELLRELRRSGHTEPITAGGITRTLYWHLAEFYLRCPRVQQQKRREQRDKRGVRRTLEVLVDGKPQFELIARRHGDCQPLRVRGALEWLDAAWLPSFPEQPHYLTGADWERLLNPKRSLFLAETA